ncbi:serine/threonine-protein kinase [Planctomycetes bacterium K23_9]|uniref:Serine/threonine-protein kinase PrkC n=1 Tax=Stieleria marina TaxID=1930275 RepID=A0A517NQE2_9BACT|nr:Serine/threonine-protein kinase PrkC [Planctomycetes bacterium K23_9]
MKDEAVNGGPPPASGLSPCDPAEIDVILERCLERFAEVAPLRDLSQLRRYLPEADPQTVKFVLIELIKLDMAMVSETGTVPPIEFYLEALPEFLPSGEVPVDLVMEEVQLRRESGETPTQDEYKNRFPQFDSVIVQLVGVAEATAAVKNRAAPPELEIGSQIDDFLIVQTLGSGAFAHVYLARQLSMARLVALKVSRGTGDEPRALSQFDHPNIVRVFDQRELDQPSVHLLYMQFHPGGTLAEVVRAVRGVEANQRDGTLLLETVDEQLLKLAQIVPERSSVRKWLSEAPWPIVVAWLGIQLARALDDAHGRDVMHRDVKPANVLLSNEGIPKLADFNVSYAGAAGRAGAAASFGGSIGYMSPEHLRAISARLMDEPEEVREKADLYSLAILLWELWQGQRPFVADASPSSWSEAVWQQLNSRGDPPSEPQRIGTAPERVLESTLRKALAFDPEDRLLSGAEMAGRLTLALHPDAAKLFDPGKETWRYKILQWSPWMVPMTVVLVPNLFVMLFNFVYNYYALLGKHGDRDKPDDYIPGLREFFESFAFWVSAVCLGVGIYFMVKLTKAFVAAIRNAESGEPAGERSIRSIMNLGQNGALIGGTLWAIAGLVYPFTLLTRFPDLEMGEAVRFFFSLVICGGVAAIYPYFGMTILGTLIYYPRLIKNSMQDTAFSDRFSLVVRQSERFMWAAVAVPLVGVALLTYSDNEEKNVVFSAVVASGAGMFLAYYAYRFVNRIWLDMARVLSKEHASLIPGLGSDD